MISILLALALGAGQQPRSVAFERVNVLPMTSETVLFQRTVLVEDGVITAIGKAQDVVVPEGVQVVDATSKFLMPGLQDLHVHMVDEGDLIAYLANGVTTVRNLMGAPWHLELRDRLEAGELLGPRFLTSGPFVNEPAVRTPEEARAAVARQAAEGYDCVKIHGNLQLDTYEALLAAGAELEIPIVGHIPRNLRAEDVLALGGQADISHGEEFLYTFFDRQDVQADVDSVERIAALTYESGIAVVPNLIAYQLIARQIRDLPAELSVPGMAWVSPLTRVTWTPRYNKYARDFQASDAPSLERRFAFLMRFTKAMQAAGVTLLLGSDALNPTAIPGISAHEELALLVQSGLTPYQALCTGTIAAGQFLGNTDPDGPGPAAPGTIAVGRRADLVLLSANPLEDVANASLIEGVCVGGRWLKQAELDVRSNKLKESYERESAFMQLLDIQDLSRAEAFYSERKQADPEGFVFREAGIASVVQTFAILGNADLALRAAELYTLEFPDSWRAWLRMAEACELAGMRAAELENLERALELRPADTRLMRRFEAAGAEQN